MLKSIGEWRTGSNQSRVTRAESSANTAPWWHRHRKARSPGQNNLPPNVGTAAGGRPNTDKFITFSSIHSLQEPLHPSTLSSGGDGCPGSKGHPRPLLSDFYFSYSALMLG